MRHIAARCLGVLLAALPAQLPPEPMLGEPAPSFRLKDLEGREVALDDHRGRFVVLHFGASW